MNRHRALKGIGITALTILAVAVSLLSLSTGSADIPFPDLLRTFTGYGAASLSYDINRVIMMEIRLPRVVAAFGVGGVLATAGASFQALLRNPLADPYILGVSGGGALGGVLAITFGWHHTAYSIQLSAFAGALATVLFVYFISQSGGRIPKYKMLLAGVVVNAFLSALIMLLLTIGTDDARSSALFWLMGDLSGAGWERLPSAASCAAAGLIVLYLLSKEMNLLLLGEEPAMELGINVERVKLLIFVSASLITAAAVSTCGLIGFVGLIVPHAVRLLWGADHRFLLPASLLLGGTFLSLADTVARTVVAPTELPVGVITAIAGGPVFVYLMKKRLHE